MVLFTPGMGVFQRKSKNFPRRESLRRLLASGPSFSPPLPTPFPTPSQGEVRKRGFSSYERRSVSTASWRRFLCPPDGRHPSRSRCTGNQRRQFVPRPESPGLGDGSATSCCLPSSQQNKNRTETCSGQDTISALLRLSSHPCRPRAHILGRWLPPPQAPVILFSSYGWSFPKMCDTVSGY